MRSIPLAIDPDVAARHFVIRPHPISHAWDGQTFLERIWHAIQDFLYRHVPQLPLLPHLKTVPWQSRIALGLLASAVVAALGFFAVSIMKSHTRRGKKGLGAGNRFRRHRVLAVSADEMFREAERFAERSRYRLATKRTFDAAITLSGAAAADVAPLTPRECSRMYQTSPDSIQVAFHGIANATTCAIYDTSVPSEPLWTEARSAWVELRRRVIEQ